MLGDTLLTYSTIRFVPKVGSFQRVQTGLGICSQLAGKWRQPSNFAALRKQILNHARSSPFRMTDVGRCVTNVPNYLVCIQDWVIPASPSETRNLLTTRWKWRQPSNFTALHKQILNHARPSLFRMTDAGNYVVHNKPKSLGFGFLINKISNIVR